MKNCKTRCSLGLFVPTFSRNFNKVSASIWIRALQMIPYYRSLGISVHVNNPLRRYDVAIVYRIPSPSFYHLCKWLKKTCGAVFFDTVVNYFIPHAHCTAEQLEYQRRIAEECDGIICSTDPIAQNARMHNQHVYIMEDPLDLHHFRSIRSAINYDEPTWGWAGISLKANDLVPYAGQLESPVLLISDEGILQNPPSLPHKFMKWDYETFPEAILGCDVALLPRIFSGDPYNQGHSAFKALVFAASGIPVVASKLPSYVRLATHYPAITFLEEHDDSLTSCLQALRSAPHDDVGRVRQIYSCEQQAKNLCKYIGLVTS